MENTKFRFFSHIMIGICLKSIPFCICNIENYKFTKSDEEIMRG